MLRSASHSAQRMEGFLLNRCVKCCSSLRKAALRRKENLVRLRTLGGLRKKRGGGLRNLAFWKQNFEENSREEDFRAGLRAGSPAVRENFPAEHPADFLEVRAERHFLVRGVVHRHQNASAIAHRIKRNVLAAAEDRKGVLREADLEDLEIMILDPRRSFAEI